MPERLAIAMGGHTTMDPANEDRSIPTQEAFMGNAMKTILNATRRAHVEKGLSTRLLTHGSGPQTGIIMDRARKSEQAGMHPLPLRYATMDLIGSLGMTFRALVENIIVERGGGREKWLGARTSGIVVNPTAFVVDPLTMTPAKPIGNALDEETAIRRRADGYTVEDRDGKGQRVLVPSPRLLRTFDPDLHAIAASIKYELLSIAGGTGGLALEDTGEGILEPRDAVIDKDRAWTRILIDLFVEHGVFFDKGVILTDAPFLVKDFSKVKPVLKAAIAEYGGIHRIPYDKLVQVFELGGRISRISSSAMREVLDREGAVDGGAAPKAEAACDAVEKAGTREVAICCLQNFEESLIEGRSGTIVESGRE